MGGVLKDLLANNAEVKQAGDILAGYTGLNAYHRNKEKDFHSVLKGDGSVYVTGGFPGVSAEAVLAPENLSERLKFTIGSNVFASKTKNVLEGLNTVDAGQPFTNFFSNTGIGIKYAYTPNTSIGVSGGIRISDIGNDGYQEQGGKHISTVKGNKTYFTPQISFSSTNMLLKDNLFLNATVSVPVMNQVKYSYADPATKEQGVAVANNSVMADVFLKKEFQKLGFAGFLGAKLQYGNEDISLNCFAMGGNKSSGVIVSQSRPAQYFAGISVDLGRFGKKYGCPNSL